MKSSDPRPTRRVPTRALIAIILSTVLITGLTPTRDPMTHKTIIHTDRAPQAIGTYSQAVKVGDTVYLSGQIPLVPETMDLVTGDMEAQIGRVFD